MTGIILLHLVTGIAFLAVTLAVQGASHFAINRAHYASIDHLRADPIVPLGLGAAFVQGVLMSGALQMWKGDAAGLADALIVSASFGLFLTSYISFAEPAKYRVPHIPTWIKVEFLTSTVQFLVFGCVLALIHGVMGTEF